MKKYLEALKRSYRTYKYYVETQDAHERQLKFYEKLSEHLTPKEGRMYDLSPTVVFTDPCCALKHPDGREFRWGTVEFGDALKEALKNNVCRNCSILSAEL